MSELASNSVMAGLVPAIHVFHYWLQIVDARHKAGHDEFLEFCVAQKTDEARRRVTVRIEGRVQGVYFRAWTDQTARALGLDGWVRNASDGSVEAVFSGPSDKVAEMLKRCETGPPDARVTAVTVRSEGGSAPSGFKVLATDHWQRG